MATDTLTGIQKAAVLLVQLGRERSAAVLKSLRENEVEEVLAEIARMQGVPSATVDAVFEEFSTLVSARRHYAQGGLDFAREVLEATVGTEKAGELLSRMKASLVEMPFEFLRRADARQVLSFLQDEHPQTVALVLAHMRADQAAIVLSGMPTTCRPTSRTASPSWRPPPPTSSAGSRRSWSASSPRSCSRPTCRQPAACSRSSTSSTTPTGPPSGSSSRASSGATPRWPRRSAARCSCSRTSSRWTTARCSWCCARSTARSWPPRSRASAPDVREKIMSNVSERAAANLSDEIELLGAVRLSTVEESQAKIIASIRSLEESGQIIISRGDRDEYVV
jgi:flagellar motor switch protein FliG